MVGRPINRLFQTNEYRLYLPDNELSTSDRTIPFYIKRHPNREMGNKVTVAKEKTALLRAAAAKAKLELIDIDDGWTSTTEENFASTSKERNLKKFDLELFHVLPKEIILHILSKLEVHDLANFVRTSRYSRHLGYDNILWKELCYQIWHNPQFFSIDLQTSGGALRLWYNWNAHSRSSTFEVVELFKQHLWRLIYIAFHSLDSVPSIVDSPRTFFTRRTSECYGTPRNVIYQSTQGEFRLVGVNQVSRVEYTVFNYILQPWHRKEYGETRPLPIYDLRLYGLRVTRTVRGQNLIGFFRRRGYYLKTDMNRKIHLAYRYFPTIRFRLYQQGKKIFLLCQDIFVSSGETVDCYTMYEIIKTPIESSSNASDIETSQAHDSEESPMLQQISRDMNLDGESDAETEEEAIITIEDLENGNDNEEVSPEQSEDENDEEEVDHNENNNDVPMREEHRHG